MAPASSGAELLDALHAVLHSKTLVDRLTAMDESPWADWARGRGLNQPGLAKLLRPFGIKPCNVREHGTDPPKKGYRVEQFDDAWTRYAPHLRATAATAATAVTSQVSGQMPAATQPLHAATEPGDVAACSGDVAAAIPALTSDITDVAAVAYTPSEDGEQWTDADDDAWRDGRLPSVPDDPRRFTR